MSNFSDNINKNILIVFDYFKNSNIKLSINQIAGIVGNLILESNIQPNAVNRINAQGICQWLGSRRNKFKMIYNRELKDSSLLDQLNYIVYEFQTTETLAYNKLTMTDTVKAAAISFDKFYERSEQTLLIQTKKVKYAQDALDYYLRYGNR